VVVQPILSGLAAEPTAKMMRESSVYQSTLVKMPYFHHELDVAWGVVKSWMDAAAKALRGGNNDSSMTSASSSAKLAEMMRHPTFRELEQADPVFAALIVGAQGWAYALQSLGAEVVVQSGASNAFSMDWWESVEKAYHARVADKYNYKVFRDLYGGEAGLRKIVWFATSGQPVRGSEVVTPRPPGVLTFFQNSHTLSFPFFFFFSQINRDEPLNGSSFGNLLSAGYLDLQEVNNDETHLRVRLSNPLLAVLNEQLKMIPGKICFSRPGSATAQPRSGRARLPWWRPSMLPHCAPSRSPATSSCRPSRFASSSLKRSFSEALRRPRCLTHRLVDLNDPQTARQP
jgi:hypothetical protein